MKITFLGTKCSLACMMAETDACVCKCGRASHGILVEKPVLVAAKCSPAAEKRCKEGNESGACKCACDGANHGVYKHIENFGEVKITMYA